MGIYQRILKILSIVLVVIGVCSIVAGVSMAVLSALSSPDTFAVMSEEALVETSQEYQSAMMMALAIFACFGGILSTIAGYLGLRAARNPRKIKPFLVIAFIMFVVELLGLVSSFTQGGASLVSTCFNLAVCTFAGLCLYSAFALRRAVKQGIEIPEPAQPKRAALGLVLFVIQIFFALNIIFTLAYLVTFVKSHAPLGFEENLGLINMVFNSVSFWLIFLRTKAARMWTIGSSALNIAAGVCFSIITGGFAFGAQVFAHAIDIFLILYMLFAKRPKQVLTKNFSVELRKSLFADDWEIWDIKTWRFWRNMIVYFIVFSVIGHWMEAAFCTLVKYGVFAGTYDPNSHIWSDWFYPFPIYGAGMWACALVLFPLKNVFQDKMGGIWKPLVVSFVCNTVVCTAIELVVGLAANVPDANGVYPLWDYSDMFCNFMGQICLQNALLFGVVATLVTWVVFPAMQRLLYRLPKDMGNAVFLAFAAFGLIAFFLYWVKSGGL